MRYEVLRPLGHGGMAELLLARKLGEQGFQKLVVIKRILPHLAEEPTYVRLFLDEARLVGCLDHPNIVQLHDAGKIDGGWSITMEYVAGWELHTILERCAQRGAAIPIEHAVRIAHDVASALHHAHECRGFDGKPLHIVHRDVSPANIMVSREGSVKLLDFGIAKAATSTMRTRTGAVKGTAGYLSPEQVRGLRADRRSDIYALGIVLWELVTGRPLYADIEIANAAQLFDRPVRAASGLRADCPRELDAIISRALAREPEERYANAEELQRDLVELARRRQLALSPLPLAHFLRDLLGGECTRPPIEPERVTVADRNASGERDFDEEKTTRALDEHSVVATRVFRTDRPPAARPRIKAMIAIAIAIIAAILLLAVPRGTSESSPTPAGPTARPPTYEPRTSDRPEYHLRTPPKREVRGAR